MSVSPTAAPFTDLHFAVPRCVSLFTRPIASTTFPGRRTAVVGLRMLAIELTPGRFPPAPSLSSLAAVFHGGAAGVERMIAVGLCSLPP